MTTPLDELVNVTITATTRTPTRAGFGTPLFAAYHTRWVDRVRSYATLAGMAADGFLTTDSAYKMAAAAFAQTPSPERVKIGRRASAPTQVVNLIPGTPAEGDVYTAKIDSITASYTAGASPTVASVASGLAAAIAALADVDAIIATGASAVTEQTLDSTAELNGTVGSGTMSPPRVLTMTFSNHAHWDATVAVVTGKDVDNNTITENFAIPNGTGSGGDVTVTGTKHFKKVTQVVIPEQSGASGTFTMGTRAPVTASGSSTTHCACTAPNAGEFHTFELVTSNLTLADVTTDPGIAADLAAIYAADPDWYGLGLDSNSKAEVVAAAAWVETVRKLFVAQSADSACKSSSSTTDVMAVLEAAAYARTTTWFHPTLGLNWIAAALLGNRLPADPGSDTWALKTLVGVSAYELTDTERANLLAKQGGVYTVIAGNAVTWEGKVAAGEWVDVVRFVDWLHARLQERIFTLQLNRPKLPFTDGSVDVLRTEVLAQLTEGIRVGGLSDSPVPTVTFPKVKDVSTANKQARRLPSGTFTATLAGAIHALTLNGTLTP